MGYIDQGRTIRALENAADIRVMGTDTLSGMRRIREDVALRLEQVRAGMLTLDEAVRLIRQA